MTDRDQIMAFADDLDKLVERYRQEFDLTYSSVVGVLEMKKWLVLQEASERNEDS